MADTLALLSTGQATTLAAAPPLADADIEALINFVLPSNTAGAINAERHRQLLMYLFSSTLRSGSLAQTWTGNEASKALSAAGGKALSDTLTAAYTTAIQAAVTGLLGGVGPAYDTLKELADITITEQGAINTLISQVGALQTALATFVKQDGTTAITAPQQIADAATLTQATTLQQVLAGVNFGFPQAINVGATGPYLMGATRADITGKTFLFTSLFSKLVSTSGTLVAAAVITVGTNAPAYDNIVKSISLSALNVVGENIPLSYHNIDIPAGTGIYVKVATAQVGGSSTYSFFGFGQYR